MRRSHRLVRSVPASKAQLRSQAKEVGSDRTQDSSGLAPAYLPGRQEYSKNMRHRDAARDHRGL